jgi:hypothetical protein
VREGAGGGGVIFDAMCRAAEHLGDPNWIARLRRCCLLAMESSGVEQTRLSDVRLPWDITAVESLSGRTCSLIEPVKKLAVDLDNAKDGESWIAYFKECEPRKEPGIFPGDIIHSSTSSIIDAEYKRKHPDAAYVPTGTIISSFTMLACARIDDPGFVGARVLHSDWCIELPGGRWHPTERWTEITTERRNALAECAINDFRFCYSAATAACRPTNWIVRQVPTERQEVAIARAENGKKIPRSGDRNKWLLITDEERVRYFREREPVAAAVSSSGHDRQEVTPHPRRAHHRHIGTNEDGSKRHTWVRACWVGSRETEIRGARYRVELEL